MLQAARISSTRPALRPLPKLGSFRKIQAPEGQTRRPLSPKPPERKNYGLYTANAVSVSHTRT